MPPPATQFASRCNRKLKLLIFGAQMAACRPAHALRRNTVNGGPIDQELTYLGSSQSLSSWRQWRGYPCDCRRSRTDNALFVMFCIGGLVAPPRLGRITGTTNWSTTHRFGHTFLRHEKCADNRLLRAFETDLTFSRPKLRHQRNVCRMGNSTPSTWSV